MTLVSTVEDVEALAFADGRDLAYVTQTTLSVDDTRDVVAALKRRFPAIHAPPLEDICYATTNRQEAIKQAARQVEAVIVVGAANSSNSQRLREVAERAGCRIALLVPERRRRSTGAHSRASVARDHRRRLGAGDPRRADSRRLCGAFRHRGRDADDGGRIDVLPAAPLAARSFARLTAASASDAHLTRAPASG